MAAMRVAQATSSKGKFEIVELPIPQAAPGMSGQGGGMAIKVFDEVHAAFKPLRKKQSTIRPKRRLTNEYDYNFQRRLNVAS
jgi:hypothetical protein